MSSRRRSPIAPLIVTAVVIVAAGAAIRAVGFRVQAHRFGDPTTPPDVRAGSTAP